MKFRLLLAVLGLLLVVSCGNRGPKVRTYADAEREFCASLTQDDTLNVLIMGQDFMQDLMTGDVDEAVNRLFVVYQNVLYKVADESIEMLKARFRALPVRSYKLSSYHFSTPGVNDLSYRYSISGEVSDGPAMKLMFNPVKVEGRWFLTLKDGNMSSEDLADWRQIPDNALAPDTLRLNRRPAAQ